MNDGWKLLLQIFGVIVVVWLFALSVIFGGIAVVVIGFGMGIFTSNLLVDNSLYEYIPV